MVFRSAVYFGLVFGTGFVLGVVRVLWLEPLLGARLAELAEAPFMLLAIGIAARYVIRRFPAARSRDYLVSGGLALLLLVVLEFTVVLALRGLSVSQYLAERDPLAGTVYVLLLLLFASMPWLLGRRNTG